MSPRRPEAATPVRPTNSAFAVNKFAWCGSGFTSNESLSFHGAGRKRGGSHSAATRKRRGEADHTADWLLRGGLRDSEVYVAEDGDTLLDLASCGVLREYVGRQRRRWSGFTDQAHALKAKWGREYAAFCDAQGIYKVIQVVVRAPVSVIALDCLRTMHARDSARLSDRLRYARKRIAPDLACDLIAAEVCSVSQQGAEVDLHFHLAIRASVNDCLAMRRYFESSGWAWWDSSSSDSIDAERHPGALAQYASKSLAEAIRKASASPLSFSPQNLTELFKQTRHLTMTRACGAFRAWKGLLHSKGLVVVEDENGQTGTRQRRKLCTLARMRDRLYTSTGARLLCLTLYDFGDGIMRPSMRVRGRPEISFEEVAATYEVADAVTAARLALSSLGSTAIPESTSETASGLEQPPSDPPSSSPPLNDRRPDKPPLQSVLVEYTPSPRPIAYFKDVPEQTLEVVYAAV